METKKIYIEQEPSTEQIEAIDQANEILAGVGLELIGTRPNRR